MVRTKDIYRILLLFLLANHCSLAQNQRVADSLIKELNGSEMIHDTVRLHLLSEIAFNHNNPDSILHFAGLMEPLATNERWNHASNYHRGSALRLKGDLDGALQAYFKSLENAIKGGFKNREAESYIALGDVYSISRAHKNSITYYSKAIDLLRALNDSINLATVLLNIGDEQFYSGNFEEALEFFNESGLIFNELNYEIGKAYNLGNVGMVYAETGQDQLAEAKINEAVEILEKLEDYSSITVYLNYVAEIYLRRKDLEKAEEFALRSLSLAASYKLKQEMSEAYLVLSNISEASGDEKKSLKFYKQYVNYKDSVNNLEKLQQMADLRTEYEVSQKQIEVDLLNEQKRNQRIIIFSTVVAVILIALLAFGLFRRNRFINRTKKIIEEEKQRSEGLLLNILPEETARELKDKGAVKAKKFESVSVMFTDFKGFTSASSKLSPEKLVDSIDFYYSKFDEIIEDCGLEKIKTVGDAYMCAGGLPFESNDHALKVVEAALLIAEFVEESKKGGLDQMARFDIRIGINTGPVVAGVVGKRKFAYDIWGDTVNTASRMESNSQPGRVNISETTYDLIKDHYQCSFRGEIEAKNKGLLKMFFVDRKIQNQSVSDSLVN